MSAAAPQVTAHWSGRAAVWTAALAACAYLLAMILAGWADVVSAVGRIGLAGIAAALLLSAVNYGLRFQRWQLYLRALGHPIAALPSLRIYLAGFALTTTPGKAGEAVRGWLLRPLGVSWPRSLAAFFSERLSDLLAVMLLAVTGLSLYPAMTNWVVLAAVLLALGYAALAVPGWPVWLQRRVAGDGRAAQLLRHGLQVIVEARQCHLPRLLLVATALSLVAWLAEAWALHAILGWMGFETSPRFAMFVYAAAMLAGALSFLPGGLGGTEASMVALLVWQGMGAPDALAATVVIRLATLWFAVLLGAVALSTCRKPA